MLFNEDELKKKFNEILVHLKDYLGTLRTGRPNITTLSELEIDQYGMKIPLIQVAQVIPDTTSLVVKLFNTKDNETARKIEDVIRNSDLGGTPNIQEGGLIRVNFPALTQEVREEIVKGMEKKLEDFKIMARGIRQDARDRLKKLEKVPEDEIKAAEEKIQKILDGFVTEIEETASKKGEEILPKKDRRK